MEKIIIGIGELRSSFSAENNMSNTSGSSTSMLSREDNTPPARPACVLTKRINLGAREERPSGGGECKVDGGECELLVYGDMHGNAFRLLELLESDGALSYNGERELIRRIYNTPPNEITQQSIASWDAFIAKLELQKPIKLILLGDLLADRGANDYFTLTVIARLTDLLTETNLSIVMSNHDPMALAAWVTDQLVVPTSKVVMQRTRVKGQWVSQKRTVDFTTIPEYDANDSQNSISNYARWYNQRLHFDRTFMRGFEAFSMKMGRQSPELKCQSQSLRFMLYFLDSGLISEERVNALMKVFCSLLVPLDYVSFPAEEGLSQKPLLLSHSHIDPNIAANVCRELALPEDDLFGSATHVLELDSHCTEMDDPVICQLKVLRSQIHFQSFISRGFLYEMLNHATNSTALYLATDVRERYNHALRQSENASEPLRYDDAKCFDGCYMQCGEKELGAFAQLDNIHGHVDRAQGKACHVSLDHEIGKLGEAGVAHPLLRCGVAKELQEGDLTTVRFPCQSYLGWLDKIKSCVRHALQDMNTDIDRDVAVLFHCMELVFACAIQKAGLAEVQKERLKYHQVSCSEIGKSRDHPSRRILCLSALLIEISHSGLEIFGEHGVFRESLDQMQAQANVIVALYKSRFLRASQSSSGPRLFALYLNQEKRILNPREAETSCALL